MNPPALPPKDSLLKKIGSMRQLAGVRRMILDDGRERGLRAASFDNGSGLSFTCLLDKGMDIAEARFKGVPFGWLSPSGFQSPEFFEHGGFGWLRSWGGGLLTSCGLRGAGAPDSLDGEDFGLHGRLSNIPAEGVAVSECWTGGRYVLSATGSMRESRMFGENLLLTRRMSTALGEDCIEVSDRIENQGFSPSHAMILYHINLGWPLLDSCATVEAAPHDISPRDETAAAGLDKWSRCQEPTPNYREQCFYHDLPESPSGMAEISLLNQRLGLKLTVSFRKRELPFLTQWKQMGEGAYVMGLEPGNCHVEGASKEREKFKSLKILQPGESFETLVRISVASL